MYYDWIVVGGGPSAMCVATHTPGRTLVIEKRASLGGCHKVQRNDQGLFCEHGPRVYGSNYVNFRAFLERHGIEWDEVMAPVQYAPDHIDGQRWYQWMSWRGLAAMTLATVVYLLFLPQGDSVASLLDTWGIRGRERRFFDTVCRFSDGAGIERYRVEQFVAGFDYHAVTTFNSPAVSLDRVWDRVRASLERRHQTSFLMKTTVKQLLVEKGAVVGVRTSDPEHPTIFARAGVVLALPPKPMSRVLRASALFDFRDLAEATAYIPYDSYALHFRKEPGRLLTSQGFRDTPWGLIYIELPLRTESTRIVSVAITRRVQDARRRSNAEVFRELLAQLPLTRHARDTLVTIVPTPEGEHAYVSAPGTAVLPSMHPQVARLGMVGCANGQSAYPFTSIESAIQNALVFCGATPKHPMITIRSVTWAIVSLIIVIVVLRKHPLGY